MNNTLLGTAVAVIVVGGAAFYGGMLYAQSTQTPTTTREQFAIGQGLNGRMGRMGGGGFTTGQILSSDSGSITVKLASGSTQIVILGTSTQILKSSIGSLSDLTTNTNVVVNGTPNSDGSLTAQSIQIRPAGMTGGFGGRGGNATPGQ